MGNISIGNIVVQKNINAFGAHAMNGMGAYAKIEGFVFLPINYELKASMDSLVKEFFAGADAVAGVATGALSAVGAGVGTGAGVTALIWAVGDIPLPPELPQAERASRARVRIMI